MVRAEARTGVRTTRRAAADVQRECYMSSDASGGASGGVVGGARCGACARQRAAEQQAQKHTRRADRELRQQRKADFPQTRRAPPRASRRARRASARPHVVRPPRAGARVRGWSEGAARTERRTGREKKQGGGGEEHAARERPCSTAAVKNHPQRTRAARVARASPVAPRAPLPRSARSGDRREDARQGRRAATGREKNQGREEPSRGGSYDVCANRPSHPFVLARRFARAAPSLPAGGRGAPTSGRARRVACGARSAGTRGSPRRAHAAFERPCSTAAVTNHPWRTRSARASPVAPPPLFPLLRATATISARPVFAAATAVRPPPPLSVGRGEAW